MNLTHSRQSSFFTKQNLFHGGQLGAGRRKTARILYSRRALHLVLKSKRSNLRANNKLITEATQKYAGRFGIKVYNCSVQRDHIHYVLRIHDREAYKKFIRALTSLLARYLGRGLWKHIPFTRIVSWGRGFEKVRSYVSMNEREVLGIQPYRKRKQLYAKFIEGL